MLLTYKFRLNPTRAQHVRLNGILEDQRQLYNAALTERIDAYKRSLIEMDRGKRAKPHTITYFDQTNSLTICRQEAGLNGVPAFLQHWTLKRLDDAYQAFFRRVREAKGKAGFPGFRSRDFWDSFGFSQDDGFRLGGARPKIAFKGLPGYHQSRYTAVNNLPGGIRIHCHRPLPARNTVRAVVLSRDPAGRKWSISIQCEVTQQSRCQSRHAETGIDIGVSKPITHADGIVVPIPPSLKHMRKAERRAQRALARARRGSRRRQQTKLRLASCKAKIAAIRRQWQHVQTARLTRCYALIGVENLAVKNMTRSAKGTLEEPGKNVRQKAGLNREMLTVGFAGLVDKLIYKGQRDGSNVIKVNPRGTSQDCSGCGAVVPKALSERRHQCPECGLDISRDHNSARNILFAAKAASAGLPLGEDANKPNGACGPIHTAGFARPDGAGKKPARSNRAHARAPPMRQRSGVRSAQSR